MKEEVFSRPRRIKQIPVKLLFRKEDSERWNGWERLAESVQMIANDVHAIWRAWHLDKDHDLIVRQWMAEYVSAKKANPKAKIGKCPVDPWPSQLGKRIWREIARRHGDVHSRVRALVINKLGKTLRKVPGSNSAWRRWILILAGRGQLPSSGHPLPIPFDRQNGRLERNGDAANPWRFTLRVHRDTQSGGSELQTLRLSTSGLRNRSLRTILERIASGEYEFKGSDLLKRDRTWYIGLCYTLPPLEAADVDASRAAVLNPAEDRPVDLWIDERVEGLRRSGRDVQSILRKLSAQFRSRQEHYRRQSSAAKGHGRKRATDAWRWKLAARRKDAKKGYNEQLARAVLNRLIATGCGRLVFLQPIDDRKATRFLESCDERTGWDWHQLWTLLERRCQEVGIAVENRQMPFSCDEHDVVLPFAFAPQNKAGKGVAKGLVEKRGI